MLMFCCAWYPASAGSGSVTASLKKPHHAVVKDRLRGQIPEPDLSSAQNRPVLSFPSQMGEGGIPAS